MLLGALVTAVALFAVPAPAAADVDDFEFESFEADYYLGVDEAGRSTLTTVETFVAVFPETDQNRGMRRAIPESYLGDPTDIGDIEVTDENGRPRPFETESDEGFLLVTSAAEDYVHGRQTYVFTYTQHNVTRLFDDTGVDEFYWDTNGTGWDQPFGSATARVHVPDALADALTGSSACYRGTQGEDAECELERADDADGVVFTAQATGLAPRENVTVAIAFESGTFVARDRSYLGSPYAPWQLGSVLLAILALVWAAVLRATALRDGRGRPTVIAEYAPPKELDVYTAASILGRLPRATAAAMVQLAVRRRIRIVEIERSGLLGAGKPGYALELLDGADLHGPTARLLRAVFGARPEPGETYRMDGKDTKLSTAVRGIVQSADRETTRSGLRRSGPSSRWLLLVLAILAAVGGFVFGVLMLDANSGGALPVPFMILPIAAAVAVLVLLAHRPLTEAGAELRDHLRGLQLYIRLAEADRLRMLQSPQGAERTPVAADDRRAVVDVYEKLLPYAVLFGMEKQWAQVLGEYYTEQSPDWYSGSGAFNATVFASSIGSLSSTAASSFSGSSSSSSSGGSSGGGSSGGGGGGGGGGGV
ncbi:MAG TPA: DUF2207 domain-containing protein [Rhodoglobus sp.]|nr:DUF2207 domain-containing protein [Rhodoglobus sp.]